MTATITISSRALGCRDRVTVKVYDTTDAMRTAARRYNGCITEPDTLGITQATTDEDDRVVSVTIRLARGHLGTEVITHEMHHATTAIYGAHVGDKISRRTHLTHYNEPLAYLHGELCRKLVSRLHALGYYDTKECQ